MRYAKVPVTHELRRDMTAEQADQYVRDIVAASCDAPGPTATDQITWTARDNRGHITTDPRYIVTWDALLTWPDHTPTPS